MNDQRVTFSNYHFVLYQVTIYFWPCGFKIDNDFIDREQAPFAVEAFWTDALRNAIINGNVAKGCLMADQSVGIVADIKPLQSIFEEMINGAEAKFTRFSPNICLGIYMK